MVYNESDTVQLRCKFTKKRKQNDETRQIFKNAHELLACARKLHECEMLASYYLGRVRGTHALHRSRVRQTRLRIRTYARVLEKFSCVSSQMLCVECTISIEIRE